MILTIPSIFTTCAPKYMWIWEIVIVPTTAIVDLGDSIVVDMIKEYLILAKSFKRDRSLQELFLPKHIDWILDFDT
eukprot:scaffold1057_cov203-Skeletonema_marinoi.AAC.8